MHRDDGAAAVAAHDSDGQSALIAQAHARSLAFGVAPQDKPGGAALSAASLRQALADNHWLQQQALPVMETLYSQIANTHSMVLLTSAQGLVLHALGDHDFLAKAQRVALLPGMDWSEQTKGTNAIGTALSAGQAVTVHGGQHYLRANKALTCSCAPIVDPQGQLLGALDVTGDQRSYQPHTLALVRMSAQMIENQMFAGCFAQALRLHFHARAEFVGTLVQGIAVFTPDGALLAANRSAQFQCGLSLAALRAHSFSSLFGLPLAALQALAASGAPRQLQLCSGVTVWGRVPAHAPAPVVVPVAVGTPLPAAPVPLWPTLAALDTGDAQLAAVIAKLRKVLDRDIAVLIQGDTGTGKDLLAQALHHDSARAQQPFVAVNCAAIPESLIEAELFGYAEGAFTGARKKGAVGKIVQAHGGTLFLDEIGDMPPPLQARLLRVLQERKVMPLGAAKEVAVDVALVCATHKNLPALMARGEFRQDLYYRLNGLVLRLPALRERSDFDAVVLRLLQQLAVTPAPALRVGVQAMALLRQYHWPGNVRQLHNLLRTAAVMAAEAGEIGIEHLPEELLDALPGAQAGQPLPALAPLHHAALQAMAHALREHRGNVSQAAKALGVSRNTIYRKKDRLPPDVWGAQ